MADSDNLQEDIEALSKRLEKSRNPNVMEVAALFRELNSRLSIALATAATLQVQINRLTSQISEKEYIITVLKTGNVIHNQILDQLIVAAEDLRRTYAAQLQTDKVEAVSKCLELIKMQKRIQSLEMTSTSH